MKINDPEKLKKREDRFFFTCIASILYIIPCLMSMGMMLMLDGFKAPFIYAIAVELLALPAALYAINAYKAKKNRSLVIIIDATLAVMHIVCPIFIGTWYLIMSPSLVLLVLMAIFSDVIG